MVYISSNLDVMPCPLLPVVLGNLSFTTLEEIFFSESRHKIRKTLSLPPQECKLCSELNKCKGGCRGRSYVLHRSFDKRDPACLL